MNHPQESDPSVFQKQMIYEMISASIELSEKLGKHPLTPGCNCITCVNKRKALIYNTHHKQTYRL